MPREGIEMEGNDLIQPEQEQEVFLAPDSEVPEVEEEVIEQEVSSEVVEQVTTEEEPKEEQPEVVKTKLDTVDEAPEVKPGSELAEMRDELAKLNKRLGYEQRQRERLEKNIRVQPRQQDANAPKQDDFETFEEYQDAHIQHEVAKGIQEYQGQQAKVAQQGSLEGFIDETTTAGRDKFTDFDEVALGNHVPITAPMLHIMQDCDNPESVAYYLGKNLKETTAISRMSPIQAARAIAHIETKVNAAGQTNPAGKVTSAPAQKVSNAPAPVKPTGSTNIITKDPEKMTQSEYEAWRAKGGFT